MKKFSVWEPSIEGIDKATTVEATVHGQAAFLVAVERKIGSRAAAYYVFGDNDLRLVKIEPRLWYAVVEMSEQIPYEVADTVVL